ncbi:MAG: hypothetical protein COW00_01935, partial [Bdellovibrio sp. CG12_big_fil_rev_8_21_14_0_65_39_13]
MKDALMKEVKQVKDVDVLHQFIGSMASEVVFLREYLEKTLEERAKAAQQKLALKDHLKVLRKMIFGKSSEKRKKKKEASDRPRSIEQRALLLHAQSLAPTPSEEEIKDLPEEILYHELSEEEKKEEAALREIINPQWEEIEGLYEESTEITVIERTYKKIKHRRKKYRLKEKERPSSKEGSSFLYEKAETLITANGPKKLLAGAHYSIDFALSVVADKYLYHCPLQRQVKQMEALGLRGVHAKTLWNLSSTVAVYLESLSKKIREEILSQSVATHVDESPWPILNKEDSDGYMWVASNQAGAFYQFEPTRSGKILKDLLKGLKGSILTDGYSGYKRLDKLPHLKLAFCWAHVRRKFFEIEPNYPKEAKEILDRIDTLFLIERKARDWEHLKEIRETESKKILQELHPLLLEIKQKHLPESSLVKAATYSLKLWNGLKVFLKDPKVPLSNNDAERALRHAVMGRKNFYGSKTINGADVAATLYTIIETCKRVELDPKSYMEMAIRKIIDEKTPLTP